LPTRIDDIIKIQIRSLGESHMTKPYLKFASALLSIAISSAAVASEQQDLMAKKEINQTLSLTPDL